MSLIKLRCKTEFNGVLYAGIALAAGVSMSVQPACEPLLGNVVTFYEEDSEGEKHSIPSPILFVSAITSASIGDEAPPEYLVLSPGE